MGHKAQLYMVIGILVGVGVLLSAYKYFALGFPLLPKERTRVWQVEAKVTFDATGGPAELSLAVPGDQRMLSVIGEDYASPGYGFLRADSDPEVSLHRRVTWSKKDATAGKQTFYYRVTVYRDPMPDPITIPADFSLPDKPIYEGARKAAADSLIAEIDAKSAGVETFARHLATAVSAEDPPQQVRALISRDAGLEAKAQLVIDLLRYADQPAVLVRGVRLDGPPTKRRKLTPLVVVPKKGHFVAVNVSGDDFSLDRNFLVWQRGGPSLMDVTGGTNARATFSVLADMRAADTFAQDTAIAKGNPLVEYSIYALPVELQNVFRAMLLIPLGALVVVILRNMVGLRTSGTFMPVLLAMAFMQMQLVTGLVIFFLVVAAGLVVRSYLSRLNLLLVPRISAVVIVVIAIMAFISVISYKLGIDRLLSATLFPTIILAWTVERLSIVWDEEGPKEVFTQTGGSLVVAILAFAVMSNPLASHMVFSFPEMLLVILAIILAIGHYTGYRLLELRRFAPLAAMVEEEEDGA